MDKVRANQGKSEGKYRKIVFALVAVAILALIFFLCRKYFISKKVEEAIQESCEICEQMENGFVEESAEAIQAMSTDAFQIGQPLLRESFCTTAVMCIDYEKIFPSDEMHLRGAEQEYKRIKECLALGEQLYKDNENDDEYCNIRKMLTIAKSFYEKYGKFEKFHLEEIKSPSRDFYTYTYDVVEMISTYALYYPEVVEPYITEYLQEFEDSDIPGKYGTDNELINKLYAGRVATVNGVVDFYNAIISVGMGKGDNVGEVGNSLAKTVEEQLNAIVTIEEKRLARAESFYEIHEKEWKMHPKEKYKDMLTEVYEQNT